MGQVTVPPLGGGGWTWGGGEGRHAQACGRGMDTGGGMDMGGTGYGAFSNRFYNDPVWSLPGCWGALLGPPPQSTAIESPPPHPPPKKTQW